MLHARSCTVQKLCKQIGIENSICVMNTSILLSCLACSMLASIMLLKLFFLTNLLVSVNPVLDSSFISEAESRPQRIAFACKAAP